MSISNFQFQYLLFWSNLTTNLTVSFSCIFSLYLNYLQNFHYNFFFILFPLSFKSIWLHLRIPENLLYVSVTQYPLSNPSNILLVYCLSYLESTFFQNHSWKTSFTLWSLYLFASLLWISAWGTNHQYKARKSNPFPLFIVLFYKTTIYLYRLFLYIFAESFTIWEIQDPLKNNLFIIALLCQRFRQSFRIFFTLLKPLFRKISTITRNIRSFIIKRNINNDNN